MVTEALNMSLSAKREYLAKIHGRYDRAGRLHKTRILDEFCQNCGYHRKAALRLLNRPLQGARRKRPGPKPASRRPPSKPARNTNGSSAQITRRAMRLLRGSGCVGSALLPMFELSAINQDDDIFHTDGTQPSQSKSQESKKTSLVAPPCSSQRPRLCRTVVARPGRRGARKVVVRLSPPPVRGGKGALFSGGRGPPPPQPKAVL